MENKSTDYGLCVRPKPFIFFLVIISLKAFAKYLFLHAFILKLLCLVLNIPEGLLCIVSCLGRYHRSPFSLCNRGLGVSDTHFHCVTDSTPTPPAPS